MVLPDGSSQTERERPAGTRLGLIVIALALLAAGILAVARLTTPAGSEAATTDDSTTTSEVLEEPTTTTTFDREAFSISDIATGKPLRWLAPWSPGRAWPIDLVSHRGRMYLFTSPAAPYTHIGPGGMTVWSTEDGEEWIEIGQVVPDGYHITGVQSTGAELVALGSRFDDRAPFLWTSVDGSTWKASEVPVPNSVEDPSTVNLAAVARTDDHLVVLGSVHEDPIAEIAEHLPPEITPASGNPYNFGIAHGPDGPRVEVRGPLGIIGYTASFKELGIDDELADEAISPRALPGGSYSWVTNDLDEWTISALDIGVPATIFQLADGQLLATGYANTGSGLWISEDGTEWTEHGDFTTGNVQTHWDGRLISSGPSRYLRQSVDGLEWESMGVNDLLPVELSWDIHPVSSGDGGVAAIATAWSQVRTEEPEPFELEEAGHTLAIDAMANTMELTTPGGDVHTYRLSNSSKIEHLTVDFTERTVSFLEPHSGEALASFSFEQLEEAQTSMFSFPRRSSQALLHTEDGNTWSLQPLPPIREKVDWVHDLTVLTDRVALVSYPISHTLAMDDPPELEILIGVIP